MGWLRRIFGIPNHSECSFCYATDQGHTAFSSDDLRASEEESESPEEQDGEEGYRLITKCRSPMSELFSHFGHGQELWPSSFYETEGAGSSNCHQFKFWDTEQISIFPEHRIWDSENWSRYFFHQPKIDHEFSTSGQGIFNGEQEQSQPTCYVCGKLIPYDEFGRLSCLKHPFWTLKCCHSHLSDGTPLCSSCERFEARDTRYATLDDGRVICSECLETAVMNPKDCQRIYLEVKEFYKSLDMEIEERIPIHLVNKFEMEKKMSKRKQRGETVGLCEPLLQPSICTMIERPIKIGDDNKIIEIRKELYTLVRNVKIKGIFLLYGFPRMLTKSILVHEMMHVWLAFGGSSSSSLGYIDLHPEVREGICQVMAHMWLSSEIKSLPSRRGAEIRLGEFFKYNIENSKLEHYGSGFRKGNKAVVNCGLKWTLNYIRMTGNFPP
ncbi:hypothetical protein MLD38_004634 [Melastoma candidum]|uniref:Uncharacterized protein n=1 Tax=Melastoma candidum TaxID=119954 RepID=A0ACB9S878_9MYRT|nr:hypothetical protein MLD38_004634 [Melastoma candidum]